MDNKGTSRLTPIKLHKVGDIALPTTSLGKTPSVSASEPEEKHEPQARLVEVQPGIYDIMVTCSCGEQMVVRCESVTTPSSGKSVTSSPPVINTETPPITPAV